MNNQHQETIDAQQATIDTLLATTLAQKAMGEVQQEQIEKLQSSVIEKGIVWYWKTDKWTTCRNIFKIHYNVDELP